MGAWRLHKANAPYLAADVAEVDFVQSVDIAYFAHIDYPLQKLTRNDHTDWSFADVTFGPSLSPPTGVSAAATQPNSTDAIATDYTYVVTAVDANGQESRPSDPDTAVNDLSLQGNYNTITWDAVPGAENYIIYKGDNDAKGYIGYSDTLTFRDRNLTAVTSDTPPQSKNPFPSAGNYPSTVTFYQQRLIAGRTRNNPNAIFGSVSADFENFDVTRPVKADDALSFALVAEKVNTVNQLVAMKKDLLAFTTNGVFAINGGDGDALTPAAIVPARQTGRGGSRLDPIIFDSIVFYQPINTADVRAIGFTFEIEGYRGNNISIFSPHLLKGRRIVSWAAQEEPYSCIWAALDDGGLLCFTWEEEQQVWGWTKMDIDGLVEQVATINEGGYDRLYILVRRIINGVPRRFHERLALPYVNDITRACHLDCSITEIFTTPTSVVGKLWHLEGAEVIAVYDGYVSLPIEVENGQITLPQPATIVTVGLPYEGMIETLPMVLGQGGSLHVERQNIQAVTVRTLETRGLMLSVGTLDSNGVEIFDPLVERDGFEVWNLPTEIGKVRDFPITPDGDWSDGATIRMKASPGVPSHVLAVMIDVLVNEAEHD